MTRKLAFYKTKAQKDSRNLWVKLLLACFYVDLPVGGTVAVRNFLTIMEAFDEKYGDIQANQRKKLKPKLSYSQVKCNRLY